jgi:hypothetical protein
MLITDDQSVTGACALKQVLPATGFLTFLLHGSKCRFFCHSAGETRIKFYVSLII